MMLAVALLSSAPSIGLAEPTASKQVQATASRLAQALGMPPEKRALVENRLAALLQDTGFQSKDGALGIRGVFAYQMGEGGLLVKFKKGKGLLRLDGESSDAKVAFKSVTFGAQIGGSSEWGIGLVLGLTTPGAFGGDYSGRSLGATFASSSTAVMELTSKGANRHKVYLIGAASGASADAGGATLTIVVTR